RIENKVLPMSSHLLRYLRSNGSPGAVSSPRDWVGERAIGPLVGSGTLPSNRHDLALALREPAAMRVAHAARQGDSLREVHPHLPRRVRIGGEAQRHAQLPRPFKDRAARVHFLAVFAQT